MNTICPKCGCSAKFNIKYARLGEGAVPSTWSFICKKCNLNIAGAFKFYESVISNLIVIFIFLSIWAVGCWILVKHPFKAFHIINYITMLLLAVFSCICSVKIAERYYLKHRALRSL
jgi:hypothetical protein